jgi:hypothetical protein
LYLNLFFKSQLDKIFQYFEEMQIPVIPLKGIVFAEKYFGHIGARSTSDIDLLIHQGDFEKTMQGLSALGFKVDGEQIPGHFHYSVSKPIPGLQIPLTVEIHWNILKGDTANLDINEFWDQAQPIQSYKYIKALSDYHTFYMICLHGWRHNLDSLKHFFDIVQMIHVCGGSIDYPVLLRDAQKHQTYKRIVRTLSIVYKQFPHLEKKHPFPLYRFNLWEMSAFGQERHYSLKNYLDFIDYQIFSYDTFKHRLIGCMNIGMEFRKG